jgi:hypothetical protein
MEVYKKINGVVYMTINKINGKKYVGKDSKNDLNYYGSGKAMKRALKKYGKESFVKVPLVYIDNIISLGAFEYHIIKLLEAVDREDYYNMFISPNHAWGKKFVKPVYCYSKDGCLFKVFDSIRSASDYLNVTVNAVQACFYRVKDGCAGRVRGYYLSKERYDKYPKELMAKDKSIHQYNKEGNYIRSFLGIVEAQEQTGANYPAIKEAATGKRNEAGGFYWSYSKMKKLTDEMMRDRVSQSELHKRKAVVQTTSCGELIDVYDSVVEASRAVNGSPSGIYRVAKGLRKHHRGYKWVYIN